MRRAILCAIAAAVAAAAMSATALAAPPEPIQLRSGWEIRDLTTPPTPAQPPPPVEGEPASVAAARSIPAQPAQAPTDWRPATVPGVFNGVARRAEYGGTVKQYRLRFTAPDVEGYTWAFAFEQARRRAVVSLNGRRVGISVDPYTPFQIPARGLRPGAENLLEVTVDSRKDPRLPEGWWNWGGITRPVTLVPVGKANLRDLGLMPHVRCDGPATGCEGSLLIDGVLDKLPAERGPKPLPGAELAIQLRPPGGRMTERRFFDLSGARSGRRRNRIQIAVPHPRLWSPDRPRLYDARVEVRYDGELVQVEKRRIGFRTVAVKDGLLTLNNRPINLRGASIHEDMPGRGAALRGYEMDTIVRELKELGANVTRSHYLLSEGLLRRFDRAGIMVYSQAPIWQRDHGANLLRTRLDRQRAVAQLRRTVLAARNHPSVIVHSVANELTFTPDRRPRTRQYLLDAAKVARDLDPWLPISLDIKTRAYLPRQSTYDAFDVIGINQYFGWYPWVEDFNQLEPFLNLMHGYYPEHALVMTEFGAEGRPDMAAASATDKGSYGFQTQHVARTVDLVDRLPFVSGAIHWTLREFEIYPGWRGGAIAASGPNDNIRHHKGVLTYDGARKPAWQQLHDRFVDVPLYR
jgi:beta-galactosidase/beta-glucuronidase